MCIDCGTFVKIPKTTSIEEVNKSG